MKENKGFTLTEILVVIAIIGIILLIAIPSILKISKSIKIRELETKKSALISAAEKYAQNNLSEYPKNVSFIQIPVRTLLYYGYVTSDAECSEPIGCVINPVDNSSMNDEIITVKRNLSITQAIWGASDSKSLIATFYANGATNVGNSVSYISLGCDAINNGSCKFKAPKIVRKGFEILGWNTNANAENGSLGNEEELTLNSSNNGIEYYAITKKNVTIAFDANGGAFNSGSATSDNCTYYNRSTNCSISNNPEATKNGYNYNNNSKWNTNADGSGNTINLSSVSESTTAYIRWNAIPYIVSLNPSSGSFTETPEGYTKNGTNYNKNYNIETPTFYLPGDVKSFGKDFLGWTGSNGNTPQYSVNIEKGSTGNKSYTANWTTKVYTLVRRTENYMNGRTVGVGYEGNYETIANGYKLYTKGKNLAGLSLPSGIFKNGRRYIVTYNIQRVAGELNRIGGHIAGQDTGESANPIFRVDGIDREEKYGISNVANTYGGVEIPVCKENSEELDDVCKDEEGHYNDAYNSKVHSVYLEFTHYANADVIWIQPNRGNSTDVTVNITDIDIYEIISENEKEYGSNYTERELNLEVFGDRGIQEWHSSNSLSKKLTTSTKFTQDSATFEDIDTSGTKAYVYGKIENKSSIPVYCVLKSSGRNIVFDEKSAISYGLTKDDSTPNYNSINSLSIGLGTFYGYVKDNKGNESVCSITVSERVINGKYCSEPPENIWIDYENYDIFTCSNGKFISSSYTLEDACLIKCPETCGSTDNYQCRKGSCVATAQLWCPISDEDDEIQIYYTNNGTQPNTTCRKSVPLSATKCPYPYNGPYPIYGCPTGTKKLTVNNNNWCIG